MSLRLLAAALATAAFPGMAQPLTDAAPADRAGHAPASHETPRLTAPWTVDGSALIVQGDAERGLLVPGGKAMSVHPGPRSVATVAAAAAPRSDIDVPASIPLALDSATTATGPVSVAGHAVASATAEGRAASSSFLVEPIEAPAASEASSGSAISLILQRALALLGTPYRWGGSSPDKGFDCSGLVGYVFRQALGIELPRVSREMVSRGEPIADRSQLAQGDLVFFGRKGRIDHVGIYVGEGRFVHAPSRGKDVMISSLETGYWSGKFMQARRIAGI